MPGLQMTDFGAGRHGGLREVFLVYMDIVVLSLFQWSIQGHTCTLASAIHCVYAGSSILVQIMAHSLLDMIGFVFGDCELYIALMVLLTLSPCQIFSKSMILRSVPCSNTGHVSPLFLRRVGGEAFCQGKVSFQLNVGPYR